VVLKKYIGYLTGLLSHIFSGYSDEIGFQAGVSWGAKISNTSH